MTACVYARVSVGVGRWAREMMVYRYLGGGGCSLGRWNGNGAGAGAEVGQEACFAK